MGLIKGLAFAPIEAGTSFRPANDKVIQRMGLAGGHDRAQHPADRAGAGDESKVYAMALSPDGRWLAAGGCHVRRTRHARMLRRHSPVRIRHRPAGGTAQEPHQRGPPASPSRPAASG